MTSESIHPARRMDFEQLMAGLECARENRHVVETRSSDGLVIYVYSNRCVYDGAWDEFTMSARGLIIDPSARRVVATPFTKFFNLGEHGITIPELSFESFEKLDGSLIIIYHHAGRWKTATKGAFNSRQAIWAQARLDCVDRSQLCVGTTYLAEATYPENRIVIAYEEPALVLLAAYAEDGTELVYDAIIDIADKLGWRFATRHHFDSISALISCAKEMPSTREGFVLRFSNGLRLKIKGEEYLRMHANICGVTPLNLWEAMSRGDDMESLRRELPEEFWDDFDHMLEHLEKSKSALINRIESLARSLENLSDKEVGLRLETIEEDLRPFIFTYRKFGADCFKGRARETLFRAIRPTGNLLTGYSALNRVLEETT